MNLGDLQRRLNEDEQLKGAFLKDPASVLREEGLELTPEMEKSVQEMLKQATEPKREVPGASIQPTGRQDIAIMITISKDF